MTKNKKYQYLFFSLIFFMSILNGGNSNLFIQLNSILWSVLFIICLKDKNYSSHLKLFLINNKISSYFFFIFLVFLILQMVPIPIETLKIFSKEKYYLLQKLNYNSFSSISLNPINTFFQILNFITLLIVIFTLQMIFYKENHILRLYFFLSLIGFLHSCFAVILYLNGNEELFFFKNYYQDSSTGFFINRSVFSIFLLVCLISSLEYLKRIDFVQNIQKTNIFFNKIYARIFIVFIAIGIITSFSKIGNFLMLVTILFYFFKNLFFEKQISKSFNYVLIFIVLFDILILGYFFGSEKIIQRFAFLKEDLSINNNSANITRLEIIYFSINQLKEFLFFGYGAGSFETIFKLRFNEISDIYANHAHSSIIEFLGEFGIIGFLILNLSIFQIFLKKKNYNFNFVLFLILALIILLFDFSLHVPLNQILFLTLFYLNFLNLKLTTQ